MNRPAKISSFARGIRLLTLASFVHFSGLNNGLAYFAQGAAPAPDMAFAPALANQFARLVNPMTWRQKIFDPARRWLFLRSARVIESASQRAVKNLLIESGIMQLSLTDMRLQMTGKANAKTPLAGVNSKAEINVNQARPDCGISVKSILMEAGGFCAAAGRADEFKGDRKKTWLEKRFHWDRGGSGRKVLARDFEFLGVWNRALCGKPPTDPDKRAAQRPSENIFRRFVVRLLHAPESSDDSAAKTKVEMTKNPLCLMERVSFFGAAS